MQIHDLNEKTLTNPAYVAFDDGEDTYKADFKAEIDNAAAEAVADTDLTDNTVAFTSGDSSSPTEWTAVDVLTSGLSLKTLFNRISTMVKNVRYIWSKIGTASMGTTATTITGAIAEHEQDISGLNSKVASSTVTYSKNNTYISATEGAVQRFGNVVAGTIIFTMSSAASDNNISLITGLPAPRASQQFIIMCVNDYSMTRAQLTSSGTLRTWYNRAFVSGNSYMINLAYVAN